MGTLKEGEKHLFHSYTDETAVGSPRDMCINCGVRWYHFVHEHTEGARLDGLYATCDRDHGGTTCEEFVYWWEDGKVRYNSAAADVAAAERRWLTSCQHGSSSENTRLWHEYMQIRLGYDT